MGGKNLNGKKSCTNTTFMPQEILLAQGKSFHVRGLLKRGNGNKALPP